MVRSCLTALIMSTVAYASSAQTPPPPNAAKQAVELRQAVYKLIGNNFKPIGEALQGRAPYDATQIRKRAERVAVLAQIASESFPETTHPGLPNTKAKPAVWLERAQFDQRLTRFAADAQALAQVSARETAASDAFKAAAGAVAQDCKGCHDQFREK